MTVVCSRCCKLRCLLSLLLMVVALFLLSTAPAQAETAPVATARPEVHMNTQADTQSQGLQPVREVGESANSGYLLQLVAGLLVVLLCIMVLAWLAKRFNHLQTASGGMLEIIGGLSMGARERIVLVRIGEQQVLLGVSPGRINALHVVPCDGADNSPAEASAAAAGGKSFARQLGELTCTAGKGSAVADGGDGGQTSARRFLKREAP